MTVVNDHIAHHKHVQALYEELLKDVKGIKVHGNPDSRYDSNFWLCTITLDENLKIKGQENAYKTIVTGAVGGAAGVIHAATSAHTDCEPNANVEALRVLMDQAPGRARTGGGGGCRRRAPLRPRLLRRRACRYRVSRRAGRS